MPHQTLYRWKKQYKGLETDQVRQFKQLWEENGPLKRLVAELTLHKTMLQDVLSKNVWSDAWLQAESKLMQSSLRSCIRPVFWSKFLAMMRIRRVNVH